jgi:hypothetical protein
MESHVLVQLWASFRKFSSVFNSLRDADQAFSARSLLWTVNQGRRLAERGLAEK